MNKYKQEELLNYYDNKFVTQTEFTEYQKEVENKINESEKSTCSWVKERECNSDRYW